jgi:hypothetical protein
LFVVSPCLSAFQVNARKVPSDTFLWNNNGHYPIQHLITNLPDWVSKFVWRSSSWEPGSKEVLRLSWDTKLDYGVHTNSPLIPILRQVNPVQNLTSCCLKIHFNIFLPTAPGCRKRSLPLSFSNHIFIYLSSHMCVLHAPSVSSSLIWWT